MYSGTKTVHDIYGQVTNRDSYWQRILVNDIRHVENHIYCVYHMCVNGNKIFQQRKQNWKGMF